MRLVAIFLACALRGGQILPLNVYYSSDAVLAESILPEALAMPFLAQVPDSIVTQTADYSSRRLLRLNTSRSRLFRLPWMPGDGMPVFIWSQPDRRRESLVNVWTAANLRLPMCLVRQSSGDAASTMSCVCSRLRLPRLESCYVGCCA